MVEAAEPDDPQTEENKRCEEQAREVDRKVAALTIPMARTDDYRVPEASGWGGFELTDD